MDYHVLQFLGIFDVGLLGNGDGLEVCVGPDTNVVKKASTARYDWPRSLWFFMEF